MTKTKLILMILAIVVVIGAVAAVAIGMNQGENPPQVQATDPTVDPTDPTGGNDPTQGNDPTEPSQGGDVTTPTEGNDPTQGGEPTNPTEGNDPTDPAAPTDPTDPTTAPTEAPTDPTQPTEPTEPVHTHSYTSKVTEEPDCGIAGVRTYTCSCGDTYTKKIDAIAHKYSSKVVEPTYDAKGYTIHTCSNCGHYYKDNYTDKLVKPVDPNHVHEYVAKVTAPTCFSDGYTTYTCSCDRTYKDMNSIVKTQGHTWSEWTSMGDGNVQKLCMTCGTQRVMPEGASEADYEKYYSSITAPGRSISVDLNWDKNAPVIYTYLDGTTGTDPKLGATYRYNKYEVHTVNAYDLGLISYEEFNGPGSDGYCSDCGKLKGDGTNGTCTWWLGSETHICEYCGGTMNPWSCHTCKED